MAPTAILLPPPAEALDTLPPGFASLGALDLREWLVRPSAKNRIVAVPPGRRFEHAVTAALGLPDDRSDVLVVYLAGHDFIPAAEWSALGLDGRLAAAEASADLDVEDSIAVASRAFDRGAMDEAARAYAAADERLGHEVSPRHAEVLTCLAEIERVAGRLPEAAALFDRAIGTFPRHRGALRGRADVAQRSGEHAVAAGLLHRLIDDRDPPERTAELLDTIAAESLLAARDALTRALALRPGDRALLERLSAAHEAASAWGDAVTARVALAETESDAVARARSLAAAARLCETRAQDEPRAVALYEAAIEDDPTVEGAFGAIVRVLERTGDVVGLAQAYERQIERLTESDASDARAELYSRLSDVRGDALDDTEGAIAALDFAVTERPDDVELRARLANLLAMNDDHALALDMLEIAARKAPNRAATFRKLRALSELTHDTDRSFLASSVLVALGEADQDEQDVFARHAPDAPLRFSRPFDAEVWRSLAPEEHDHALDAVFAALAPAAARAWLADRPSPPRLPDESLRHETSGTTVAAVRSVAWAARILGVAVPAIYADPNEQRVTLASLPGEKTAVLIGRSLLTGRTAAELGFVAAHHLAYHRPHARVAAFYPEPSDLNALARAAIATVRGDAAAGSGAARFARWFGEYLDDAEREALDDAVVHLLSVGDAVDVRAWLRGLELTACRAGLTACGNVTVAGNVLAVGGGHVAGLTAADRQRDLFGYAVSATHLELRRSLGVAVTA